jgi:hypothetical protein
MLLRQQERATAHGTAGAKGHTAAAAQAQQTDKEVTAKVLSF